MTKSFDTLLESILNEMMPITSEFGSGTEMGAAVAKKVPTEKSQHWGPIQKLDNATRTEIINAIISNVFTDNENNTYSSIIDTPEELKNAIKDAIKEVASSNPTFAKTLGSGKWAVQFLADRLSNKELLGNVKYTTAGGSEAVKQEVTQKEVKAALNKALEKAPTEAEVTSAKAEAEQEASEEVAPSAASDELETEVVYQKAADLDSDDADLQKAFAKIPADKDLSWEQLLKTVGMTKAQALIDAGGLSEITKEVEVAEPEFGEKLPDVAGEEQDEYDLDSDFDTSFRRSMSPFASSEKYGEEY
jgi:hypothetical protein